MKPLAVWDSRPDAECIYLRREVYLDKPVELAHIQCASEGAFRLQVNNQVVGHGLGETLTGTLMWEEFDIKAFLQPGKNKIQILSTSGLGGAACFWGIGRVVYEEGSEVELVSGPDWRTAPITGAKCSREEDQVEIWVAGLQEPSSMDWLAAQIVVAKEPRSWSPTQIVEGDAWPRAVSAYGEVDAKGPLEFVDIPSPFSESKCVHREGILRPGRIQSKVQTRVADRAVYLVLDFGRLVTGFPQIRLHGMDGAMIEIGFARTSGRIEGQTNYLSTDGPQAWTGLRLRTCRYLLVRLSHCSEEIQLDAIGMLERRIGVGTDGNFIADAPWQTAWDTGHESLAVSRQELYLAYTPMGEIDWLQGYAWSLNDFYLSGDTTTAGAMLASADRTYLKSEPLQGFAYCLLLEAYYQYSGDKAGVIKGLETALDFLMELASQKQVDGLLVGGECPMALNSFYGGALAALTRLCRDLKMGKQGQKFNQEYQQIQHALDIYWSVEQGLFTDKQGKEDISQWANGLALFFSLTTLSQQTTIVSAFATSTASPVNNLLEAFFVAGGLWSAGEGHQALDFMHQHWGNKLEQGDSSWMPNVNEGYMPWAGSEYFLGSQLLGVLPQAAGYTSLMVLPQASSLSRAKGQVKTSQGLISVEWYRQAEVGKFDINLQLEKPLETSIWVPRQGRGFPTVRLNGETVWRNEKVHLNPYVRAVSCEREHLGLQVEAAGTYHVEVE